MLRKLSLFLLVATSCVAICQATQSRPKFLPKISNRAEFDLLSRVSEIPFRMPHMLFLIDREHGDKVYYIDSKRPWHHQEFANAEYLTLENSAQFLKNNYYSPNRRFILGWVGYYTPIKRWGYEFWEGDLTTAQLVGITNKALNQTFFTPLAFKPNSLQQEGIAATVQLSTILPTELAASVPYQPLNLGTSVGQLRMLGNIGPDALVSRDDIVVVDSLPVGIAPVAGLITASPASALSHLNILARGWGIPSAYIKDANKLKAFDGKWVRYEAKTTLYSIRKATKDEIAAAKRSREALRRVIPPRANLTAASLLSLSEQRAKHVTSCGTKSANLGEVAHAAIAGVVVPSGFTIPFSWFDAFVRRNGLSSDISEVLVDPAMKTDAAHRRDLLKTLRDKFVAGSFDPKLRAMVLEKVRKEYADKGLFVRSSTNAEDLPNFSGAGIYTTVPNVKGDDAIVAAIKTVWSSVWNDEAYAAREQAGLSHSLVFMAVLLQEGINAESAGVMITTDPFDREDVDSVFISAKR